MSDYSQFFKHFTESMATGNNSAAIKALQNCFNLNPKVTLLRLYERRFLFNRGLIFNVLSALNAPEEYLILFKMLQVQAQKLVITIDGFRGYSLKQFLQGAANLLERDNAELTNNAAWNVKHANGNELELEGEKQVVYFSTAGIVVQEMLDNCYHEFLSEDKLTIKWDEIEYQKFGELFSVLSEYNEIRDTIERFLFCEWTLKVISDKVIECIPGDESEGKIETDYINNMKSKLAFDALDRIAEQNLLKTYMDILNKKGSKPKEFWKHLPDTNNEEEMKWYAEAMAMDISQDPDVQREITFLKARYFPGIEDFEEIEIGENEKLPLYETMRVISFIKGLSKKYVRKSGQEYLQGVNLYHHLIPPTTEEIEIEKQSKLLKGNPEALNEMLAKYYNENVFKRQQAVISGAKGRISNENCLIQFNYEKLVKTIQWLHQFDANFIKRVIELFVYDPKCKTGITRQPFFLIGENLCWMPYMVAYASFAESLLENLVSSDDISIHNLQTKYYEASLNHVFEKCGYKVIKEEKFKNMYDEEKNRIGDFDLLAYKDGLLLHMELKLTGGRNGYYERYGWKTDALNWGSKQLKNGKLFINNNKDHIKKILGLGIHEEIREVKQYLISNTYLYDHEIINEFMKVSYFEVNTLVNLVKLNCGNVLQFVEMLEGNKLFAPLNKQPKMTKARIAIGDYTIVRPDMLLKNRTAAL